MARLVATEGFAGWEAGNIARRLSELADRLEHADTPEAFVAAIEANQGAWLCLDASPQLVGAIPRGCMRAAMSLSRGGIRAFDDHKVELLIDLDRRASAAIAASVQC